MLAIYACLKEWRTYLMGQPFTVYSDHRNLTFFQTRQTLTERQRRMFHELADYDFKIVHRRGTLQVTADALSRREQDIPASARDERLLLREHQGLSLAGDQTAIIVAPAYARHPDRDPDNAPRGGPRPTITSPFADKELTALWDEALRQNPRYYEARTLVRNGARKFPPEWGMSWQMSEVSLDHEDRLLWRDRTWIPHYEPLRTKIVQTIHDSSLTGHPGRVLTRDLVARNYAWPGLTEDVRRFVRNCQNCDQSKAWREQRRGLLKPLPIPERPWQELAMDFVTDLPPSDGYTNILGVTDRLTKSVILILITIIIAQDIAKALLRHVFAHHGIPKAIVSDRGTQFTSLY